MRMIDMLKVMECLVDGFMKFINVDNDVLFSWHSKKVGNIMIKRVEY